jgi:hypothetical protein
VALKPRLEALRPGCLPESPLGKAIHHALAEREPLNHFLQDGRQDIGNNLTENDILPRAVGKKYGLFIGHPDAGYGVLRPYWRWADCQDFTRRRVASGA